MHTQTDTKIAHHMSQQIKNLSYKCLNTQYNHCSRCISTKGIYLKRKGKTNILYEKCRFTEFILRPMQNIDANDTVLEIINLFALYHTCTHVHIMYTLFNYAFKLVAAQSRTLCLKSVTVVDVCWSDLLRLKTSFTTFLGKNLTTCFSKTKIFVPLGHSVFTNL